MPGEWWSSPRGWRMNLPTKIFFVLGAALIIQSVWSLLDGHRFLRYTRACRAKPPRDFAPPAAMVIPCKGVDAGFEENLENYLGQDYPHYQAIFAVASEEDPSYEPLRKRLSEIAELGEGRGLQAKLVVAGYSPSRGEKVNNLLRGLAAVEPGAEIYVFADMDARPTCDWLRCLVAPLQDPQVTVSTGFRWYLPGASFVSQLRAAWDTSIATLLGDHDHNFAWGGSMAIRASDFVRLGVAERYWTGTVSDDYALTRAVREARGRIRFEPRCLLASREDSKAREFLRWANRQIIITRVYAPHLWRMGLAAYVFFCGTMLWGLIELLRPSVPAGWRWGVAGTLAVIQLLGVAKARLRSVVAREVFPEEGALLKRFGGRYWQWSPLVPWVMLANFVTAGFTRRIEWRGTCYELISPNTVRVLWRRDEGGTMASAATAGRSGLVP